jgi:hypothetical protein
VAVWLAWLMCKRPVGPERHIVDLLRKVVDRIGGPRKRFLDGRV